ncbi:hypothetical protein FWD07_02210 [Candidatus Saccharibacteria bacterium]|nr:hypothetical protein [Candidatus Saccharibacteria bacterium]
MTRRSVKAGGTEKKSVGVVKKSTRGKGGKKTSDSEKVAKKSLPLRVLFVVGRFFKRIGLYIAMRAQKYRARRPHRSFRKTDKRDYERSMKMPGYFAFTGSVFGMIGRNKKLFGVLILVLGILNILLVGMMSQDMYASLADALDETTESVMGGDFGQIGRAGLLLISTATTGGLNTSPSEVQQVFGAIIFLMMWLATVWLLRNIMAGNKVRMRDGLYNAFAPIISTALVLVMLFIQAIPALVAFIAYSAAVATDFLSEPFYGVLFWVFAGVLVLISLYLITGTILALITVTIPGMYPLEAVKIAGDLVIGRRLRVILRTFFGLIMMALMWAVIMIPIIMFDSWIKGVVDFMWGWPIVPVALIFMTAISVIFMATYMYMMYRKLIDDGSSPA